MNISGSSKTILHSLQFGFIVEMESRQSNFNRIERTQEKMSKLEKVILIQIMSEQYALRKKKCWIEFILMSINFK